MTFSRKASNDSKARRKRMREPLTAGRPSGVLPVVATVALLTARFLIPTEASVDGETLWIVQLWLVAGIVCVWHRFLDGQPLLRFDLPTLAVGLLVAGHVTSGVVLLFEGGDKRAAVNVMWEWCGLGVTFYAVRTVLRGPAERVRMTWALTSVGVALAGFGLYQHYVGMPRMAAEYGAMRSELDELLKSGEGTRSEILRRKKRIRELSRSLIDVPTDGPGRIQFEQRLAGTEPFGTFALANTFAGLLAAMLFPVLALAWKAVRNREHALRIAGAVLCAAAIAWCLILTKSRTAWVGCAAGGVAWWALHRTGTQFSRKRVLWVLGGVVALAGAVSTIAFTGGLDAAVLSETLKSLRYRAQYWTGTVGVLRESPWLGTGPGNFRQHYLAHKPPESSEEITDPHNMFLDVWCNGGLTALVGLLLWIGVVFVRARETEPSTGKDPPPASMQPETARWIAGVTVGFLLAIGMSWFIDDGNAMRNAALLCGAAIAMAATMRVVRNFQLPAACLAAALCALLVHLSGAGGIERPAITQLLFVLAAAIPTGTEFRTGAAVASGGRLTTAFAGTAVLAILFGACLSWATIPVITRTAAVSSGRASWPQGRFDYAAKEFVRAAENDPLSPEPHSQMALMLYAQWRRSPVGHGRLNSAIRFQRLAIERNPRAFGGYRILGHWLVDLYEATNRREHIEEAVDAYEQAVALYPHHAQLLSEQVTALAFAGRKQQAAATAGRALEQDDVNRREGHSDKYLPAEIRAKLEQIAAEE